MSETSKKSKKKSKKSDKKDNITSKESAEEKSMDITSNILTCESIQSISKEYELKLAECDIKINGVLNPFKKSLLNKYNQLIERKEAIEHASKKIENNINIEYNKIKQDVIVNKKQILLPIESNINLIKTSIEQINNFILDTANSSKYAQQAEGVSTEEEEVLEEQGLKGADENENDDEEGLKKKKKKKKTTQLLALN